MRSDAHDLLFDANLVEYDVEVRPVIRYVDRPIESDKGIGMELVGEYSSYRAAGVTVEAIYVRIFGGLGPSRASQSTVDRVQNQGTSDCRRHKKQKVSDGARHRQKMQGLRLGVYMHQKNNPTKSCFGMIKHVE